MGRDEGDTAPLFSVRAERSRGAASSAAEKHRLRSAWPLDCARGEREEAEAIIAAARVCVGARFRLHGRAPGTGLDCVGLAALAYAGRLKGAVPSGYALRGGDPEAVAARIDALGLARGDGRRPGDLLLLVSGPFQLHLAIRTERGFVHADAGLRRVVETPGEPRWPLAAAWRASDSSSPNPLP